ncbi:hypothetical protein ABT224_17310 [Streptomyces sp. NPDC001584]|uniref:hypothetical protein n=1 Tax=Streptomyces sp. NPDC001584 TaxID=3154521 RepID=UPI00332456E9
MIVADTGHADEEVDVPQHLAQHQHRHLRERQLFVMPALSEGAADRFSTGGLKRAEIDGTVDWGRTGSMGRSTSGVFATEGGRRTVVHSLLPASRDGELMRGHIAALVGAAL